jgi:hypothetical protein
MKSKNAHTAPEGGLPPLVASGTRRTLILQIGNPEHSQQITQASKNGLANVKTKSGISRKINQVKFFVSD